MEREWVYQLEWETTDGARHDLIFATLEAAMMAKASRERLNNFRWIIIHTRVFFS